MDYNKRISDNEMGIEIDQVGLLIAIIGNKEENQAHLMLLKASGLAIAVTSLYLCLMCAIFFSTLEPKM